MEIKGTFLSVKREPGRKDPGSFLIRQDITDQLITCAGFGWEMKKGTPLLISGEWENEQINLFHADDIQFDVNDRKRCVRFFAKNHFKGVGEKKAEKLYQFFMKKAKETDVSFDRFSDEEIFETLELAKISECKVALSSAIRNIAVHKQIRDRMRKYHVTPKDVEQIYISYGDQAWEEIMKSPYDGMGFDIPFQVCDRIAWDIGKRDVWDSDRAKAIVKQVSFMVGSQGSCCIRMKDTVDYIFDLLKDAPFPHMTKSMIYSEIVASDKFMIRNTKSYGPVVYPKYYYYVEKDIVSEIRRLENSKKELKFSAYRGESPLDEDQIQAMNFLKTTGLKILYGGPGAGKTTVLREFITEYRILCPEQDVFLCAPTGRAAARVTESCHGICNIFSEEGSGVHNAVTIHKLLGVVPYREGMNCTMNFDNQLPMGLFILDEVSMVDEVMFLRFLQAIPSGSMVILSGDPDQLPSVQSGTVLRDLIDSGVIESKRLNGNHRQTDNGKSIVDNYKKLLCRDIHLVRDQSFQIIQTKDIEDTIQTIRKLYEDYYKEDSDTFQILTSVRKGELGKIRINQLISEWRAESGSAQRKGEYAVGDRVIMTKNNYKKGYWNGDVGIIQSITASGEFLVQFYEKLHTIDQESALEMEHAFAITVHKSQGAEYRYVVLVLDPHFPSMLYRSLLLTAITRAKERVFILASDDTIRKCILTDKEACRITGLTELLQEQ